MEHNNDYTEKLSDIFGRELAFGEHFNHLGPGYFDIHNESIRRLYKDVNKYLFDIIKRVDQAESTIDAFKKSAPPLERDCDNCEWCDTRHPIWKCRVNPPSSEEWLKAYPGSWCGKFKQKQKEGE
jgi:hypothetical protein